MTTFDNALYFHDIVDDEELKQDINTQIMNPCEENDLWIKNLKTSDIPDFESRNDYEVLFFDWGGMSLGNSMLEHFCNRIITLAENRPNIFFVMVSDLTKDAMKDAKEFYGEIELHNVFLSINDFGAWCRKYDTDHNPERNTI